MPLSDASEGVVKDEANNEKSYAYTSSLRGELYQCPISTSLLIRTLVNTYNYNRRGIRRRRVSGGRVSTSVAV